MLKIDILQHEIDTGAPHWLSPQVRLKDKIDAIRKKHRDAWLKRRKPSKKPVAKDGRTVPSFARDADFKEENVKRDEDGKFAEQAGSGAGDRETKRARLKEIGEKIKPLAEKGGLTAGEARQYEKLNIEAAGLRFDLTPPLTPERVNKSDMSTLSPDTVVAAQNDLYKNRAAYMALASATGGVHFDADTEVDDIMNGRNPDITASEFYRQFDATRAALRKQYGPAVTLYRAEGAQKKKATTNWATTREFAEQFGSNVTKREVPVEEIIAANIAGRGRYHELIVGEPPAKPAQDAALREFLLGRFALALDAKFDESKIKRDEDGQFASTGGGSHTKGMQPTTHKEAISAIQKIMDDDYADYGLRITEEPIPPGKIGASRHWDNGEPTDTKLPGTSVVHIEDSDPASIERALRNAGIGARGPNGHYFGKHVVLVKGEKVGSGDDVGEAYLRNAESVLSFEKGGEGPEPIVAMHRDDGHTDIPDAVKEHKYFAPFIKRGGFAPAIEGDDVVFHPEPSPHMEKFPSGREDQPDKHDYYDPRYAELKTLNEDEPIIARKIAVPKDDVPFDIEPLDDPDTVYRGMSAEEYDDILKSGEVKSKGTHNIGSEQEGLTYWTTDTRQANSYANGFAPAEFKPTPSRPAYIVATKRPKETRKVKGTDEREVGVARAIKRDELTGVWRGDVVTYTPARYRVPTEGRPGFSGVGPRADVRWSKIDLGKDTGMDKAPGWTVPAFPAADAGFREEQHPRGHQGNPGQFSKGGGAKKAAPAGKAAAEPAQAPKGATRPTSAPTTKQVPTAKPGGHTASLQQPGGQGKHPGHGYSAAAQVDANGVIHTTHVDDAVRALYENRKVELNQPREVATLLDRLGDLAKRIEKYGGKAPNFDLCNVSVKNTNLFCAEERPGIPRVEMPQLPDEKAGEFQKYLSDKGYKVSAETEQASYLRATQRELVGAKVAGIMKFFRTKPASEDPPLFVSKDNYIVDGHHRWAARVGLETESNKLGGTAVNIMRVDMPILDLLQEAEAFTGGVGHKKATAHDKRWTMPSFPARDAEFKEGEHRRDEGGQFTSGGRAHEPPDHQRIESDDPSIYGSHLLGWEGRTWGDYRAHHGGVAKRTPPPAPEKKSTGPTKAELLQYAKEFRAAAASGKRPNANRQAAEAYEKRAAAMDRA